MKNILLLAATVIACSNSVNAQLSSNFKQTYVSQFVPLPLEAFEEANRRNQARYDAQLEACQDEIAGLYKEASTYPQITDGKHLANLVGPGTCNEMYVIVQQGKVFSIAKSDGSYISNFTISTQIKSCVSKVGVADSETGVSNYYHVVFLKDIYGE